MGTHADHVAFLTSDPGARELGNLLEEVLPEASGQHLSWLR